MACIVTSSGTSSAAAVVSAASAIVRQYFIEVFCFFDCTYTRIVKNFDWVDSINIVNAYLLPANLTSSSSNQGFYPTGIRGGLSWDPSAALVKAVLIAGSQHMLLRALPDDAPANIDTLATPNPQYGFGRASLFQALRLIDLTVAGSAEECTCSGKNSLLFNTPEGSAARAATISTYGIDYGIRCAAWNDMSDGRPQRCNTIAASNAISRATALGLNSTEQLAFVEQANAELGPDCCRSWCFVNCTCNNSQPFYPPGVTEPIPGLCISLCTDDWDSIEFCPWANTDAGLGLGARTFARDHVLTAGNYDPVALLESYNLGGGAIAEGEAIDFVLAITGATNKQPLVVALVWTGILSRHIMQPELKKARSNHHL